MASVAAPAATMRLNAFQRLMRRWNTLGPYTAGQVMQVTGAADVERWQTAVQAVLAETGLGRPKVSVPDTQACFLPVGRVPIDQPNATWYDHASAELNRPFGPEDLPLRFFVVPAEPSARVPESHFLGVIYDHWVADSRAMRELMHRIYLRYAADGEAAAPLTPLTVENPSFRRLYRAHLGPWLRWSALRQSLRNIVAHRRAHRINLRDPLDFTSRLVYRQLPAGLIDRVHEWGRQRQASVNDVFLTVIAQTMGRVTAPDRYRKRRRRLHLQRRQVALGTIVDIRDYAAQPLDQVFGLYLSSYSVVLERPEATDANTLVETIRLRTQKIKADQGMVRGFAALETARRWWDWFPHPRRQAQLFYKTIPITAGISNVKMSASWVQAAESDAGDTVADATPRVLDYLRISPVGPLLPLVFTLTTMGDRLSLCVTFRTTAFTEEQAGAIVDEFIARLEKLPAAAK
jgi:hypothetical protein